MVGNIVLAVVAVALVWVLAWYRGHRAGFRLGHNSGCKRMISECFDARRTDARGRVWVRANEEASKTWSDSGDLPQEACDD